MQLLLRRDSSMVRALVRMTRGPGFDPQLRCLNLFRFFVPISVLSFDKYENNVLIRTYMYLNRQDRTSFWINFDYQDLEDEQFRNELE